MAQQMKAATHAAFLTLLATVPAFGGPIQAPRPPQAPPVQVADAGLFLVAADLAVNAAPQAPAGFVPAKACSCSPECVCGCNQGQPCRCGNAANAVAYAPTSYWSCGPNGCRLVTGTAPAAVSYGSCADGSCGVATSGVYGGGCGPGGCGAAPASFGGGGRFLGGRGRFFGGFRGRGCAGCR